MGLSAIGKYLNQEKIEEPVVHRHVWVEYEIIPGVEIHVRRDVEERLQKKVLDILKVAQSIAKGDKEDER